MRRGRNSALNVKPSTRSKHLCTFRSLLLLLPGGTAEGSILGPPFHPLECLLPNITLNHPGGEGVSLGEYIFNLLQRPPSGLGKTEEHVDERGKVEGSEDEIGLPRDVGETRGDGPSQSEIKHPGSGLSHDIGDKEQSHLPVCGSSERNGLGTHPHRENLGRVGPGYGPHGNGKGADEEVRAYDDTFGDRIVTVDNPDTRTIDDAPFAETALKSADEVQPEAHHHGTNQEKRSATPLVNVDDSGD